MRSEKVFDSRVDGDFGRSAETAFYKGRYAMEYKRTIRIGGKVVYTLRRKRRLFDGKDLSG